MHWFVYAMLAAIFYLAHDFFLKKISTLLSPVLSSFLLFLVAAVTLGAWLAVQTFLGKKTGVEMGPVVQPLGLAGICLALATLTFIKTFEAGAPFSIGIPVIYVVMIVGGVVVGYLFFQEKISLLQLAGVVLCAVGLFMVSWQQGSSH